MSTIRLRYLKTIRVLWPFLFTLGTIIETVIYLLEPINSYLDQKADDFVADFWNRKIILFLLFTISGMTIVAVIASYYIFFNFEKTYFLWIPLVLGPLQLVWSWHIMSHSSWHFVNHDDIFD